jgi:hypothetical protein
MPRGDFSALSMMLPKGSIRGRSVHRQEAVKAWMGRNLALIAFLSAYFFTIVLANLLYPFLGFRWAWGAIGEFRFSQFPTAYTFGYWFLLLLPFMVTPVVAHLTRDLLSNMAAKYAALLPDFSWRDYLLIVALLYGYLLAAFWLADVPILILQAHTPAESSRLRFQILSALGYWPQMVLKSLLMFLAIYAFIQALRSREARWVAMSAVHLLLMSVFLLLLNMKWPALLLYVALSICVLLFSRKGLYAKAIAAVLSVCAVYLVTVIFFMRINPEAQLLNARYYIVQAFDRMAIGYPHYYQTFTEQGQICGSIIDRIQRRRSPCQPSTLVFEKVFGKDEFGGMSTQPAAVHIYGYALGGWGGAMTELLIASVILGAFMSLPFSPNTNTTVHTIIVMGGLAGYFFSQLPVEGGILYDHGVVWWLALVLAYAGLRNLPRREGR